MQGTKTTYGRAHSGRTTGDGVGMSDQKKVAAFFDFDETLLELPSGRPGLEFMRETGRVTLFFLFKVVVAYFAYKRHWISEERMSRLMLGIYKNGPLDEVRSEATAFYNEWLKPHLAPKMLERISWHRESGHTLILISGSVRYVLEPVAWDLGFDHVVCTELEVGNNGRFTGRPDGPICVDVEKGRLAALFAQTHGIDLSRSYAYGNHHSDLALLRLVGNPHVVEPTRPLLDEAQKNGWPVLTFR